MDGTGLLAARLVRRGPDGGLEVLAVHRHVGYGPDLCVERLDLVLERLDLAARRVGAGARALEGVDVRRVELGARRLGRDLGQPGSLVQRTGRRA